MFVSVSVRLRKHTTVTRVCFVKLGDECVTEMLVRDELVRQEQLNCNVCVTVHNSIMTSSSSRGTV